MLESRKKKRENRSYSMKCCNSNALGMIFADSIDPFAGLSFFYWTSPAKHTTYFFNCIVTHKYFSNSVYDDNSILCAGRVIRWRTFFRVSSSISVIHYHYYFEFRPDSLENMIRKWALVSIVGQIGTLRNYIFSFKLQYASKSLRILQGYQNLVATNQLPWSQILFIVSLSSDSLLSKCNEN